jgi:Trk-type K+ transport system membrane component
MRADIIVLITLIALFLFGGIGFFIYCELSLQKMQKTERAVKNDKK